MLRSAEQREMHAATLNQHRHFMELALEQARRCNPVQKAYSVGAVIADLKQDICVVCGFSRELDGNTHAEQVCLIKAGLSEASPAPPSYVLYTTMEPCSKRLSGQKSCTELLLNAKIKHVVAAAHEPDFFVKCAGYRILKEHDVMVTQLPEFTQQALEINSHILGHI